MEEELEIGDEAPFKRKRGIGEKRIYCRSYPSEEELLEMVRQDGMVCINDATTQVRWADFNYSSVRLSDCLSVCANTYEKI